MLSSVSPPAVTAVLLLFALPLQAQAPRPAASPRVVLEPFLEDPPFSFWGGIASTGLAGSWHVYPGDRLSVRLDARTTDVDEACLEPRHLAPNIRVVAERIEESWKTLQEQGYRSMAPETAPPDSFTLTCEATQDANSARDALGGGGTERVICALTIRVQLSGRYVLHFLPVAPTCAASDALIHDGRHLCLEIAPPSTTREAYEATVRRMRQTLPRDAVETARVGEEALREMPCAADIWTFLGDAYLRQDRKSDACDAWARARACVLSGEDDKLSAPRWPEQAFGYSPLGAAMVRLETCVPEPPPSTNPP